MRYLYIDIDSLRPDHLGCYGYERNTSPHIDALAAEGVIFENCYITDAPCLPSRTSLWSGRCGFRTGVVNHGGARAVPFSEGRDRDFCDLFDASGWMGALRKAGVTKTATISSFGERHSAWHWYAGFHEVYNSGEKGMDIAEDIAATALDWLNRNGQADSWFLHVNFWDPHTPYRTPLSFDNPFQGEPLPAWLNKDLRQRQWAGFGPHSAHEPSGLGHETFHIRYPRVPETIDSMDAVRQWIDGYDVGIRYMDEHLGRIINTLADLNVLDETVIVISADHGENLGELNVWGDHQTADHWTCRVPLIVRWPGLEPRRYHALHYHHDWAATMIELAGGEVPSNWDGRPFTQALHAGRDEGRPYLVLSQNAWSCQRSVRFDQYLCMRTYHDGFKELEPVMLFNLEADPHEQEDLAEQQPQVVERAMAYLADWEQEMMLRSEHAIDPMQEVLREGGPYHVRDNLAIYVERLRSTGRGHHAERLLARHGGR